MYVFTRRKHSPTIAFALVSTFASALFRPTAAILFGKIFSALNKYSAGTATLESTIHDIAKWCAALAVLGCCAWIVEGAFLSSWMTFGESQAKNARDRMLEGMLVTEMEWYDSQQDGIGALLIRVQTQVKALPVCANC